MEYRYEFKYLVSNSLLPKLREMIEPYVEIDRHVEHRETHSYTVRSIYFDTPNFDYYTDKVEGVGSRKKVRLRAYHENTDESVAFLEVKRKFEVPLKKFRSPLKAENILSFFTRPKIEDVILNDFPGFQNSEEFAKKFYYYIYVDNLLPVILISYDREPYNTKFDSSSRITFDKNLRSYPYPALEDIYREDILTESLPGRFVLEVKFDHTFPRWMKQVIAEFDLKSEAVSKYLTCIDSHALLKNHNKYYTIARTHSF